MPISRALSPRASAGPAARFTAAEAAALVRAVAVHDDVDLLAGLPARLSLDYDAALLERCYWLSFRLWEDVDRTALARLAGRLARAGRLEPADLRAFKNMRARAKQLRFAFVTLGADHVYPRRLDQLTRLMGAAQDAARCGLRMQAALLGIALRVAVARPAWAAVRRELAAFMATDRQGFRAYVLGQMGELRRVLACPAVTNRTFHDARKIISRLVATYDAFTVLAPSDYHRSVDRYLSTINGLMGGLHDAMTMRKTASRRAYERETEPLPPEIAARLTRLATAFERA